VTINPGGQMEHILFTTLTYFNSTDLRVLLGIVPLLLLVDGVAGAIFMKFIVVTWFVKAAARAGLLLLLSEFARRYGPDIRELDPGYLHLSIFALVCSIWVYTDVIQAVENMSVKWMRRMAGDKKYIVVDFATFGTGNSDYKEGVVRVTENIWRDLKLKRNDLLAIRSPEGKTIYRVARGDSGTIFGKEKFPTDLPRLGLELDDRKTLNATDSSQEAALTIWKASKLNMPFYLIGHTDVLTRANFRISLFIAALSIILGTILQFPAR
jgi:hypothetical protein